MIKVHFDVQTGAIKGFYPDFIQYRSIPEPTIEIDEEMHRRCIAGQARVDLVTMQIADHEQLPTAEEVQAAAWEKIKAQRTERDKQPIAIKGKLVDFADADDREKLRTAREALETATELGQPVSEFEWTCADNSTVLLGLADFKMIPLLAAIRSDANHKKSREIKDLIYAAKTPAAVDAILNDPELWGD